jgi:hypothetical protein
MIVDRLVSRGQVGVYVREDVVSRALPFEEFCTNGAALAAEGRLLVRLGDRWLSWRSAGPLLLSLLAYRRPLPNVSDLLQLYTFFVGVCFERLLPIDK